MEWYLNSKKTAVECNEFWFGRNKTGRISDTDLPENLAVSVGHKFRCRPLLSPIWLPLVSIYMLICLMYYAWVCTNNSIWLLCIVTECKIDNFLVYSDQCQTFIKSRIYCRTFSALNFIIFRIDEWLHEKGPERIWNGDFELTMSFWSKQFFLVA